MMNQGLLLFHGFLLSLCPIASSASDSPADDAQVYDAEVSDAGVTDAVERELLYDHGVPSNGLDVSTVDGIVTLRGAVPAVLAKERAVRIAETVKGVRSVVDLIEVSPSKTRTDGEVQHDVENALLFDPATDSYEIDVSVEKGHATLTGTVDSWAEKRLSEKVAASVSGVTGVTNQVSIEYGSERSDKEIERDIAQSLRWNHLVDDGLIDVAVTDGAVKLTGTVGSAAEKRQARYDAWTNGVRSVDASELEVARWARDEDLRKQKYVTRSDEDIRMAVKAALMHDPRVFSFNVDPAVAGSVVTLRGVVDNLKAKRAAEHDAKNTVGVYSVRNHLKVRPVDKRADNAIAGDIRDAFLRDPFVERFETTVSVYDGTAYLYGTVDSYFEKSRADDLASRVNGVVDVVNHLSVHDDSPVMYDPWVDTYGGYAHGWHTYDLTFTSKEDLEIERDIEEELFWSPFVDADEVTVTVVDGVATLSGTVDSHMEKGAARDNAYDGGAIYVRNDLEVGAASE